MDRSRGSLIASLFVLISAVTFLAYGPTRAESSQLFIGFGVAFIAYIIVTRMPVFSWPQLLFLAFGLRIALFLAPISWTDDHYRYIWDGLCTTNGISPYAHTPEELVASYPEVFTSAHFELLNSPKFHTVYPPVAEAVFATAVWIGDGDLWRSTLALRLLVIAFEILTILLLGKLLEHVQNRIQRVALYALNPLVLLEFSVNLHTEAFMIAPCLGAIYFLRKERYDLSAILLATAAAAKLWPLLFLAWVPSKLGVAKSARYIILTLTLFLLSWIPLYTTDMIQHFASSLKLYVSYLEFNGPFFEAFRALFGDGPVKGTGLLTAITLIGLGIYSLWLWRSRKSAWADAMLWLLAIYLFGAQAVHPWYMLPLVAFSALTGWRWPILWSLLIIPTYLTYASEPFTQPYWWLVVEYVALFSFMGWEFRNRTKDPALAIG